MQSDIDAQLTSFFEETPPRDFAKVGVLPLQLGVVSGNGSNEQSQ